MGYIIPLTILIGAGLIWPVTAYLVKREPQPSTWRWTRLVFIATPFTVGWAILAQTMGWPDPVFYPAIMLIWYIVGRSDQQRSTH